MDEAASRQRLMKIAVGASIGLLIGGFVGVVAAGIFACYVFETGNLCGIVALWRCRLVHRLVRLRGQS